jgi:hypothetical protein
MSDATKAGESVPEHGSIAANLRGGAARNTWLSSFFRRSAPQFLSLARRIQASTVGKAHGGWLLLESKLYPMPMGSQPGFRTLCLSASWCCARASGSSPRVRVY